MEKSKGKIAVIIEVGKRGLCLLRSNDVNIPEQLYCPNWLELVWEPKEDESYYLPDFSAEMVARHIYLAREVRTVYQWQLEHGLIFRTKEEAIAKTKEMLGIEGQVSHFL